MKAFAIAQMVNGKPNVNFTATPCYGYALAANLPGKWGLYLFSGTAAQLTAINALASVVGLVAMTETGIKWVELDNTVTTAIRTKLNNWLTARGYPNIPAGWTFRRIVQEIYARMGQKFDLDGVDIADAP